MRLSNRKTGTGLGAGSIALSILMIAGTLPAGLVTANAQRRRTPVRHSTNTIYVRAYQHGYSAGYFQGKADWTAGAPRDYQASKAYQERDVRYEARYAHYPQYRDGYDLGFELGYTDGYFGRARNLTVPVHAELLAARTAKQRGDQQVSASQPGPPSGEPADQPSTVASPPQYPSRSRRAVVFDNETELRLKLTSPIDTRTSHKGDQFTAEVIAPGAYEGSTVYGHISSLQHSGRVSGKTSVALAFDSITLPDGRTGRLDAQLVKIYESENVKRVDEEGNIESGSRTRDSEVRGGIGAAAGAIIGGIAGGGKGALIGLILGGAAGVGTVYVEGNKNLILDRGTEMLIRVEPTRRGREQ